MDRLWWASVVKVKNRARQGNLADRGGIRLLDMLDRGWRPLAEEALATGEWEFQPLVPNFHYRGRLQTLGSQLDRVIIQLVLARAGYRAQQQVINANCDDELMPLPPAFRFRPPDAMYMYSPWFKDYGLWQMAERMFRLRGYSWVVKCDIRNFFYAIHRPRVLELLEDFLDDEVHYELLKRRFLYPLEQAGTRWPLLSGLPVDEPSSHLAANLFLSEFDAWAVKELCVPHIRYVDDLRFFCISEEEANRVLREVGRVLQVRFSLLLNGEKSSVEPLEGKVDPVEAKACLERMKGEIKEPLESRRVYVKVTMEELSNLVDDCVDMMQEDEPNAGLQETTLSTLTSVRCYDADSKAAFADLMVDLIDRTGGDHEPGRSRQYAHRLAAIAMAQLGRMKQDEALPKFVELLGDPAPKRAELAFRSILGVKTNKAAETAETCILETHANGDLILAVKRLHEFLRSFPPTKRLRDAFERNAEPELQLLLSAPAPDQEEEDRIVRDLCHESAPVRRNAALRLAQLKDPGPSACRACRYALAGEESRDVRLALLVAAAGLRAASSVAPEDFGVAPRTTLEASVHSWLEEHGRPQDFVTPPGGKVTRPLVPEVPDDDDISSYGSGAIE